MRRLRLYLILALLLTFIPRLQAETTFVMDGITYENREYFDYYYFVIAGDTPYSGDIVIPDSVEFSGAKRPVRIGAKAFSNCTELTSVTLPPYISVDDKAFENCTNLITLNLSAGQITLYHYAFKGCVGLKEVVTEGELIMDYADYAFQGCTALEKVSSSKTPIIPKGAFEDCTSLKFSNLNLPGLNTIGQAFKNSLIDDTIVLSGEIKYGFGNDKTGTFEESGIGAVNCGDITEVPLNMFKNCDNLRLVTVTDSVKRLNTHCFAYCDNLDTVNIEEGDYILDVAGFYYGSNEFWDNKNYYPGMQAFTCPFAFSNVKNIIIDRQITGPLFNVADLVDPYYHEVVEFPEDMNITYGGKFTAFPPGYRMNVELTEFECPPCVTRIMTRAFEGNLFEQITIPSNVVEIDEDAFRNNGVVIKKLVFEESTDTLYYTVDNSYSDFYGHDGPFANSEIEYLEFNRPARQNIESYWVVNPSAFADNRIKELKVIDGTERYDLSVFMTATIVYVDFAESVETIILPWGRYYRGNYNGFGNLIVRNPNPPDLIGGGNFSQQINIYVPDNSVDAYKSDERWGVYNILPLSEFSIEAMDNIWESGWTVGIENISDEDTHISYSVDGGQVRLIGEDSATYEIYTLSGQLLYRGNGDYQLPTKGIYLLNSGRATRKIVY